MFIFKIIIATIACVATIIMIVCLINSGNIEKQLEENNLKGSKNMISAIVCVDQNYGIGNKNDLLVHIPEDMKMFKDITTNGTVIMGRKTYDSLPKKPLPNRNNIIITSKAKKQPKIQKDGAIHSNMDCIKSWLANPKVINENSGIYVIGGGMIYKELLQFCERVYITKIFHAYDNVDTYFPNIDEMSEWEMTSASEVKEYNGIKYQFCIYDRIMCEE